VVGVKRWLVVTTSLFQSMFIIFISFSQNLKVLPQNHEEQQKDAKLNNLEIIFFLLIKYSNFNAYKIYLK